MSHLSDVELIDLIDGALPSQRERHVNECEACRARADDLRLTLNATSDVDIPEPSPLFWDHFSARVHAAVQQETPEGPGRWFARPALHWAAAGALVTAVLVGMVWRASAPTTRQPPISTTAAAVSSIDVDLDAYDPQNDQAWDLVRSVADDAAWDAAAEDDLGVRPGSAERALASLTPTERLELARLLQAETRM